MDENILLESWDRQTRILDNLIALITPDLLQAKPSPDGMTLLEHICHVHQVRRYWLREVAPERLAGFDRVVREVNGDWVEIDDLDEIKRQLTLSAAAVREAVRDLMEQKVTQIGPYSHPAFFLQHMVWHEGYHFALILLALRLAGIEPSVEWEEENVWAIWRS